jgi:hypothetical protein
MGCEQRSSRRAASERAELNSGFPVGPKVTKARSKAASQSAERSRPLWTSRRWASVAHSLQGTMCEARRSAGSVMPVSGQPHCQCGSAYLSDCVRRLSAEPHMVPVHWSDSPDRFAVGRPFQAGLVLRPRCAGCLNFLIPCLCHVFTPRNRCLIPCTIVCRGLWTGVMCWGLRRRSFF